MVDATCDCLFVEKVKGKFELYLGESSFFIEDKSFNLEELNLFAGAGDTVFIRPVFHNSENDNVFTFWDIEKLYQCEDLLEMLKSGERGIIYSDVDQGWYLEITLYDGICNFTYMDDVDGSILTQFSCDYGDFLKEIDRMLELCGVIKGRLTKLQDNNGHKSYSMILIDREQDMKLQKEYIDGLINNEHYAQKVSSVIIVLIVIIMLFTRFM